MPFQNRLIRGLQHWSVPVALSLGVNVGVFAGLSALLTRPTPEVPSWEVAKATKNEISPSLEELLREQQVFNEHLYEAVKTGQLQGMAYHEAAITRDALVENIERVQKYGQYGHLELLDAEQLIASFEQRVPLLASALQQQRTIVRKLDELQFGMFENELFRAYQGREARMHSTLKEGRYNCDSSAEFAIMAARFLGIDAQKVLAYDDHLETVVTEGGTTWKYLHTKSNGFRSDYAQAKQGLIVPPSFLLIGYLLEQGYALEQFPPWVEELWNTRLGNEQAAPYFTNTTKRLPTPGVLSGIELPDLNRILYELPPSERQRNPLAQIGHPSSTSRGGRAQSSSGALPEDERRKTPAELIEEARREFYLQQPGLFPSVAVSVNPLYMSTDEMIPTRLDILHLPDDSIDWLDIARQEITEKRPLRASMAIRLDEMIHPSPPADSPVLPVLVGLDLISRGLAERIRELRYLCMEGTRESIELIANWKNLEWESLEKRIWGIPLIGERATDRAIITLYAQAFDLREITDCGKEGLYRLGVMPFSAARALLYDPFSPYYGNYRVMMPFLENPESGLRDLAYETLGSLGAVAACPDLLAKRREEKDEYARINLYRAIGKLQCNGKSTYDLLAGMVEHGWKGYQLKWNSPDLMDPADIITVWEGNSKELWVGLEALKTMGDQRACTLIRTVLDGLQAEWRNKVADWVLKDSILRGLGALRCPEAYELLLSHLDEREPTETVRKVSMDVVNAFGDLGDKRAYPPLIDILRDERVFEVTRGAAAESLLKLGYFR